MINNKLDGFINSNALQTHIALYPKIVIFDDIFPHLLSAFRIAEFNYYLKNFKNAQIFTDPKAFAYINEKRSFNQVKAEYESYYPEYKERIHLFNKNIEYAFDLAYMIFLNNAFRFIDVIEKNNIPFVFTLYPGGGFELYNKYSDEKLKRICASPNLKKIIVTQSITKNYLLERGFINSNKIEFIYGGVLPSDLLNTELVKKKYYKSDKNTFDICFVANKYMPKGINKGYDVFIEVANKLNKIFDDIKFHVVGNYDENDIDVKEISDRITFYGIRNTKFFPDFYSKMDIILSPNLPYILSEGNFDGFPTGCCIEAGLSQVAVFCTDELKLNNTLKEREEIVIIKHDSDSITDIIKYYYNHPNELYIIGQKGQTKFKKVFDIKNQMSPRMEILTNVWNDLTSEKYVERPIVSVCMITYNHEKYISEAIENILAQKTNFPIELIIGDDCSKDNTSDLCFRYEFAHPGKIKLLKAEKNYGMILNFLRTLRACRGKYIALCEGDDYWIDPDKLQKQVDFLEMNQDSVACYHSARLINEDQEDIGILPGYGDAIDLTIDSLLEKNRTATASVVFRNVLRERDFEDIGVLFPGDWALYFILTKYGKFNYLDFIGSVYRIHKNGAWTSLSSDENNNIKIKFYEGLKKILPVNVNGYIEDKIKTFKNCLIKDNKYTDTAYKENLKISKEKNEFLAPELSIDNMDKYLVRTSILNSIKDHLPKFFGTLLDIGCGQMPYKKLLTSFPSKVEKYIGMDIENPLYQKNVKPDLFWDGNKIPMDDNSVDCVVATEFFEHVPYPEKIMQEVRRVLKPEGVLFFTVPFIWSLHSIPHDEYRFTPFALERMLRKSGFKNINLKPLGGWDASLAQTIGLWVRRKPMSNEERKKFSESLLPFYKNLIESDQIPEQFTEGQLITGLSGTAVKSNISNSEKLKFKNLADDKISLAIFTPNLGTLSETFIKKHIDLLLPGKTVVVTGNIFDKNWVDVPVLQIPYSEGPSNYSKETEEKVEAFLMQHNVTHILVEYGCYGTDIIELNSRKLKLPIFVHFHGGDAAAMLRRKEMVELYKWMGEQVTGVIAVAKPMAERLINIGIPANKVIINHYGIDIPEQVEAQPEKFPCHFIFVGRLTPKKAPALTLRAFAKAYSRIKNIHLDIVGDHFLPNQSTSIKAKLEDYITKNNLHDAVTLHGSRSNEYVKEILAKSSVYVQHSITVPETGDAEGLPNSILEASAVGLPVLSTFHEGIPEEVENFKTGLLVNEFDIDTMAEYMVKLASDPLLRKKMGLEGRKKVENEFSKERSIEGLRKIIFSQQECNMRQKIDEVRDFIAKGKLEEAKQLCYEMLNEDTMSVDTYFLLGEINYILKNYEQALRIYNSAFEISAERIDVAVKIVLSNVLLNRIEDAIHFLKKVIIANPYDPNLLLLCDKLKIELQWEDIKDFSSIKLYAGDIPEKEEYKNLIGLSIEKNDFRHIRHDVTKPFPLPDNSVDSFQAEDVFEHINYEKLPAVFDEIYRVLKPGAAFRLSIPDYGCDVLIERSIKDKNGKIIFDPAGGGTIDNPGHLWYPVITNVEQLLQKTKFARTGKIEFLHHYNPDGTFLLKDIDYSKGFVMRNPDNDKRVQNPRRPMSMVVDLIKGKTPMTGNDFSTAPKKTYYDEKYFNFQKKIGEFGGVANRFKFTDLISPTDTVIDYGCGGGFLLKNLNCSAKIGVEINKIAADHAKSLGINVYENISDIPDNIADVIVSNHALEHVYSPLDELKKLHTKLKKSGKIIFVVPHQDTRENYNPEDVNKHLYTWNQLTLGNLFSSAGYKVLNVQAIQHMWPANYEEVFLKYGEQQFHNICHQNAVQNNNYQIRIVAER